MAFVYSLLWKIAPPLIRKILANEFFATAYFPDFLWKYWGFCGNTTVCAASSAVSGVEENGAFCDELWTGADIRWGCVRYLCALMKNRMDGRERSLVGLAWDKALAACVLLVVAIPCLSQAIPAKVDAGAIVLSDAVSVKMATAAGTDTAMASAASSAVKLSSQPLVVVGFAGGFVRSTSTVHGEVELAARLRARYGATIRAEVFENHRGDEAYREILRLAGLSNSAAPSAKKKAARIILYGHSWGASEAIAIARRLAQDGVPILLVAEVDRVAKPGEDDSVIPANVVQAINFYQVDGILHGRRTIEAADPAATTILGNIRFSYKDKGVPCPGYPWYTRLLTKPHIEIENDPRVWKKVEALIAAKVTP